MNRNRAKELLPIITAFANGEEIQCRNQNSSESRMVFVENEFPRFEIEYYEFRIKPKPREFWINIYPSGVGFDCFDTEQKANLKAGSLRSECIRLREVIE